MAFLASPASHISKVAHVLALTAAILVIVWVVHYGGGANLNSVNADLIFNVHPLVMTLCFIIVTGEAIMAYKTIPSRKSVQKRAHMMLQLLALGLGILGVYAAFKYHRESQVPNMYSLHSWLGICTISLFALQPNQRESTAYIVENCSE
ncbi:Transmembrane ascorbate ferrireductase 1 [Apostasia shenzhenica]|uniref:Transmembrane ascorbate ferrireductase 1 n=1 Tax=Apostasia shenzhenica TaxID=1088818 RepID=A0A2I0A9I6_9ASPA|nr:Transmembrane ascorbate ferrireductase 1 [Apostasia shenzhenica]